MTKVEESALRYAQLWAEYEQATEAYREAADAAKRADDEMGRAYTAQRRAQGELLRSALPEREDVPGVELPD